MDSRPICYRRWSKSTGRKRSRNSRRQLGIVCLYFVSATYWKYGRCSRMDRQHRYGSSNCDTFYTSKGSAPSPLDYGTGAGTTGGTTGGGIVTQAGQLGAVG